jgi:GNAT superfamily N-acetyltransferase
MPKMSMSIPSFEDALQTAERKLSHALEKPCKIHLYRNLDENLKEIIKSIDHEKFREELRYSDYEIDARIQKNGFICLIAYLDEKPIAIDFGYDDDEEGVFYSDVTAALVEGKGVGTTLFALELLHSYELGYIATKQSTEEMDESGRRLRSLWEKFGFKVTSIDSTKSIDMKLDLSPNSMRKICEKYLVDR